MSSKILITAIVAVLLAALAFWAIDVDVDGGVELPEVVGGVDMVGGEMPNVEITGDLEMPEVQNNMELRGGEMPRVDVDTVDVDLDMEQEVVEVPTIDVNTEEKVIEYPTLSIDGPEEDTVAEDNDMEMDIDNDRANDNPTE